ncbi:hypothetical protein PGT21_028811 [Puccinia graminis f. sp. tritici]|uniref:Uncharacterized protein n=1 Tax=Puccinia graminis f. sp. tritici TaxID=56615 RepID=A0A5B0S4G1_PUCGR|nr:hypothetical protein PGT21_028811 [Puccinia graminis f. sp. tritici]KAA1133021.1 hypothetical protein PGTUg99_022992 [Puccinia graminis f. sp. tritici]
MGRGRVNRNRNPNPSCYLVSSLLSVPLTSSELPPPICFFGAAYGGHLTVKTSLLDSGMSS